MEYEYGLIDKYHHGVTNLSITSRQNTNDGRKQMSSQTKKTVLSHTWSALKLRMDRQQK